MIRFTPYVSRIQLFFFFQKTPQMNGGHLFRQTRRLMQRLKSVKLFKKKKKKQGRWLHQSYNIDVNLKPENERNVTLIFYGTPMLPYM